MHILETGLFILECFKKKNHLFGNEKSLSLAVVKIAFRGLSFIVQATGDPYVTILLLQVLLCLC